MQKYPCKFHSTYNLKKITRHAVTDYYVAVTYGEEDLIEIVWDDFQDILK